jgi:hypothetical protein
MTSAKIYLETKYYFGHILGIKTQFEVKVLVELHSKNVRKIVIEGKFVDLNPIT